MTTLENTTVEIQDIRVIFNVASGQVEIPTPLFGSYQEGANWHASFDKWEIYDLADQHPEIIQAKEAYEAAWDAWQEQLCILDAYERAFTSRSRQDLERAWMVEGR